jgi:hypothetical protein
MAGENKIEILINSKNLGFILPDVGSPASSRFFAEALDGLPQQISHPWLLDAPLQGGGVHTVGTVFGEQFVEDVVQNHGSHSDSSEHDA